MSFYYEFSLSFVQLYNENLNFCLVIFLIYIFVQMITVFKFRWFVAEFSSALCLFWLCVCKVVSHFENNRISSPGFLLLLFILVLGYPPFLTVIKSDWKMSRNFDLCLLWLLLLSSLTSLLFLFITQLKGINHRAKKCFCMLTKKNWSEDIKPST